jgi:hypothetical protein
LDINTFSIFSVEGADPMRNRQYARMAILVAWMVVCCGCGSGKSPPPETSKKGEETVSKTGTAKGKAAEAPPASKHPMPAAKLSVEDMATCLVKAGDRMPDASLPDLQGKDQPLKQLYGKRLTFVCLWTAGDTQKSKSKAQETLDSLAMDLAEPFAKQGVAVIAIDEGDKSETVSQMTDLAAAKFPSLLDPDGRYFALVATKLLPRIYLLDADGKVLWFDREYSGVFIRKNIVPAITEILEKR